jgi:F-type H+-transporting ATPase subunit delta
MKDIVVGSRYAKSLISLAQERNQLDEVKDDMQALVKAMDGNHIFKVFLKNPVIPKAKKQVVLEGLFKQANMGELAVAMIRVLVNKNRESYLYAVATEFIRMHRELNGIKLAEITTTFKLDESLRNSFVNIVKSSTGAKTVQLSEKVKPEIIGGYVLKVDDTQIDESVRTKLNKLKNLISR